jgi:SAM-dependent methyltransferase
MARPPDAGGLPHAVASAADRIGRGRALVLRCGFGDLAIALAQRGWSATGVDDAGPSIEAARRKADWTAGAMFLEADPARPSALGLDRPFDLVVDAGCFDDLGADARPALAREVVGVVSEGGTVVLFAKGPWFQWPWSRRTRAPEVRETFGRDLELVSVDLAERRGDAWFTLRRSPGGAPPPSSG